jgi:hypothetical protein
MAEPAQAPARVDVPFELTAADVAESLRAVLLRRFLVLGALLALVAVLAFLDGAVGTGAAWSVGCVLGLVVAEVSIRRQADKLVGAMPSGRIVAGGDRLEVFTALAMLSYDWALYVRATRLRRVWVLRSRSGAVLSLPRSAFDVEQAAAFEAILRSRGLLAPTDR